MKFGSLQYLLLKVRKRILVQAYGERVGKEENNATNEGAPK